MTFSVKFAKETEDRLPNRAFTDAYRKWCRETFGPSFEDPKLPRKWSDMRWAMFATHVRFKNEEDMTLFILKWT
ncbi:MAG TPA: hypothetical protein VFM18_18475 [Methanosarcina sp.]|nr:hypothetical protein [Methanosarcina sp.]